MQMQAPSGNSLEREMAWSRKLAQMDHDSLIESARAEGYTIGYSEGYAEGFAIGQSKGENQVVQLMARLFSLGRQQDVEKAANDVAYREKLYLEFGL
ncbi:MAG: hypothetical protein IJ719_15675 [Clostridia bacterium]|nr:hypothetical protein [Clostridia bacterium]